MKVGPDFEAPEAPVQDNWLEEGDNGVKADPAELTTWWDVFEDPVLTRLVETAYRQNRTLQ